MESLKLNQEQLDVLKEIGTVGGGSAATALSQILRSRVSIMVPRVKLINADRVSASEFLIPSDELAIAVELSILGEFRGAMLVLYSQKSALTMIDILMKRPSGSTRLLNLMEASAMAESSQILCSSYLYAVGEMLGLRRLMPSTPRMVGDRMDRLNSILIRQFMEEGKNYVLPIENNLIIKDVQLNLFVIFLLEHDSIKKILKITGI